MIDQAPEVLYDMQGWEFNRLDVSIPQEELKHVTDR